MLLIIIKNDKKSFKEFNYFILKWDWTILYFLNEIIIRNYKILVNLKQILLNDFNW